MKYARGLKEFDTMKKKLIKELGKINNSEVTVRKDKPWSPIWIVQAIVDDKENRQEYESIVSKIMQETGYTIGLLIKE